MCKSDLLLYYIRSICPIVADIYIYIYINIYIYIYIYMYMYVCMYIYLLLVACENTDTYVHNII